MMPSYPLVVLEGIDGSGKTTLRNYVWDRLLRQGIPTIAMGQHSWLDVDAARLLVSLRSSSAPMMIGRDLEMIRSAYLKDKYLHWQNSLRHAQGQSVVLLDRYFLSDAVYLQAIYGLNSSDTIDQGHAYGLPAPEVLVYLDIDETHAEQRVSARGRETKHYEEAVALGRVRAVYQDVLSRRGSTAGELFSKKFLRLSSRTPTERQDAVDQIFQVVRGLLPKL
jgi:dTMP kinase